MLYDKSQRDPRWLEQVDLMKFRLFVQSLHQINPYNEVTWRNEFTTTDLYKQIKNQLSDDCLEIWTTSGIPGNSPTPREKQFNRYWNFNTFYYLYPLVFADDVVYDLGCGGNLFKPFFKNLIGIDPFHPNADIDDLCDDDFVKGHNQFFANVFAINSLHFVSLHKFSQTIDDFYSMLTPDGLGYISFGLAQMIALTTDQEWLEIFGKSAEATSLFDVVGYVDNVLRGMKYNFKIIDQNYFLQHDFRLILGNEIDGNIRLLIQR